MFKSTYVHAGVYVISNLNVDFQSFSNSQTGGKWNSACKGRKTWTFTGEENRSPLVDTVKAHRDHLPAS
jgi:hypothetical protein